LAHRQPGRTTASDAIRAYGVGESCRRTLGHRIDMEYARKELCDWVGIKCDHVPSSQIAETAIQVDQETDMNRVCGRAWIEDNSRSEPLIACNSQIGVISNYCRVCLADWSRTGFSEPQ
jgi:hypothetical protein